MHEFTPIVHEITLNSNVFADWSLIVFTVFAQSAMAITIFAAYVLVLDRKSLAIQYWKLALINLAIAFIASLGHLHSPLNALYTITQISHSWLSREILSTGALLACLVWLIFIQKWRKEIGFIASFVAMVYFYVTMKVYTSIIAVPYWDFAPTFSAFLGTSLVLGGAGSLILSNKSDIQILRLTSLMVLILGAILSAAAPYLWVPVTAKGNFILNDFPLFVDNIYTYWILHIVLLIIGLGLLLSKKLILDSKCKYRPWIVFAILCIAELFGRTLFFIANIRLGV